MNTLNSLLAASEVKEISLQTATEFVDGFIETMEMRFISPDQEQELIRICKEQLLLALFEQLKMHDRQQLNNLREYLESLKYRRSALAIHILALINRRSLPLNFET